MNKSSRGGIARALKLDPKRRSAIARKAARARWNARSDGILTIEQIRKEVRTAIGDCKAQVYLFGSYARGEATRRSDVDVMVVVDKMPEDWLAQISAIRRELHFKQDVDLDMVDLAAFDEWKVEPGSVQYEIAKEGIRLV